MMHTRRESNWLPISAPELIVLVAGLLACGQKTEQPEIRPFGGIITPPPPRFSLDTMSAAVPGSELGQVLGWNGTSWQLDRPDNPEMVSTLTEEFWSGTACTTIGDFFAGSVVGSSTCNYTSGSDGLHPGVLVMTTGTGAGDGVRVSSTIGSVVFGSVPRCVTWLWNIQNLSTSVDQFVDRVGYMDSGSGADAVDTVEAVYDFATSGVNKWAFETSSNSTRTITACTGSTGDISAGTWYKIKACVNAAATSATLTINGNLCATNTTNIPSGTARSTAIGAQHFNAAGSTPAARVSSADFVKEVIPFSVAR